MACAKTGYYYPERKWLDMPERQFGAFFRQRRHLKCSTFPAARSNKPRPANRASPNGATQPQPGASPRVAVVPRRPRALEGRPNQLARRAPILGAPFQGFGVVSRDLYPGRCPGLLLGCTFGAWSRFATGALGTRSGNGRTRQSDSLARSSDERAT